MAKEMINLISDTVTKPTPGMLEAMMAAEVGDDVFGQDPTVCALEQKMATMFNKEAGLFCPSGTMTNQIAIKMHTRPLDEVICDHYSHIYQYEVGGYAQNSGVSVQPLVGKYGKITADQISDAVRPDHDWLPVSRLVVIENSCNKGGGSYYTLDEITPIRAFCQEQNLALHLDGARLFNVLVETGESTHDVGPLFDSISICLSKGLGAPVGSVLLGDTEHIKSARRIRKVMGGGMRQAGYLAAAGLYALDHHIPDLKKDNDRARYLGDLLRSRPFVGDVRPVKTNIIIFSVHPPHTAASFQALLSEHGISAVPFGPQDIRFVLHRDLCDEDIEEIARVIQRIK